MAKVELPGYDQWIERFETPVVSPVEQNLIEDDAIVSRRPGECIFCDGSGCKQCEGDG